MIERILTGKQTHTSSLGGSNAKHKIAIKLQKKKERKKKDSGTRLDNAAGPMSILIYHKQKVRTPHI